MTRARTVDSIMQDVPVHGGGTKPAIVMTENAVHTVQLPEGHFTALVLSRPGVRQAIIDVLDHDEVEALILWLRNSVEDAKLLDAGKAPIHAAPSLERN